MSSRGRRSAQPAGRSGRHASSRPAAPSGVARWRLPGIGLGLVAAGLTIFFVIHYSRNSERPAGIAVEEGRGKAARPASADPRVIDSVATNQPGAKTGEDRVVALVEEGNRLLAKGNYAEAAQKLEQAVLADPDNEDVHYNLAIALARSGKTEEAKKQYAEALKIFPDHADAHNNLGNLLMTENKLGEAIEHFREAIRIMPENASFHSNLGTAHARRGEAAEAMEAFSAAVKLKPDYVQARVNLANACLACGRVDEAIAQLKEALRLQPDFQPAIQTMQRARQRQSSGVPR